MEHKRLYVVDNSSEEQSVKQYLKEWCSVSKQIDIFLLWGGDGNLS